MNIGQWLWLSWKSSASNTAKCVVRIQSLANFRYCRLYWKDESKEKRPRMAQSIKSTIFFTMTNCNFEIQQILAAVIDPLKILKFVLKFQGWQQRQLCPVIMEQLFWNREISMRHYTSVSMTVISLSMQVLQFLMQFSFAVKKKFRLHNV